MLNKYNYWMHLTEKIWSESWDYYLSPHSRQLSCANLRRVSTFPSPLDSLSCSLTRARWDSLQWLLTMTSSTTFSCWTWDTSWRWFSPTLTWRHYQLWRMSRHSGDGWSTPAILSTGTRSWSHRFLQIIISWHYRSTLSSSCLIFPHGISQDCGVPDPEHFILLTTVIPYTPMQRPLQHCKPTIFLWLRKPL